MPSRSRFRIVERDKETIRVNERIRVPEIRVISEDGEQLGVMTPQDALTRARDVGLDLVEVAANSRPPVCRIMDYGRYKYEQKKKKSGGKQSNAASLKEIKLRPGTDMHDLEFKLNNARKFLIEGDKVKVTVMFRGREMVHTSRGRTQLNQVRELLGSLARMENPPRMEGRFMSMILVGDREAIAEVKKAQAAEAAELASESVESSEPAKPAVDDAPPAEVAVPKEAASEAASPAEGD